MRKFAFLPAVLAAVILAVAIAGPVHADSRQKNKNLWRNLAIGGAVIAGHGLITHHGTEALVGAAGAAYAANRYEQDRRSQSRARAARESYYRSYHRRYHTVYYRERNLRYHRYYHHRRHRHHHVRHHRHH